MIVKYLVVSACFANSEGAKFYNQLIEKYKNLDAYEDEGTAVYYIGKTRQTLRFKTKYRSPNLIRFEFIKHHPHKTLNSIKDSYVILCDGKQNYLIQNEEIREQESVQRAFSRVTGISSGVAPIIPSLLIDEGLGAGIHRLQKPKHMGDQEIGGERCIHLKALRNSGTEIDIWVSKRELLIRKIITRDVEIVFASININGDVQNDDFKYPFSADNAYEISFDFMECSERRLGSVRLE